MKNFWFKKIISCVTLLAFVFMSAGSSFAQAVTDALNLPVPGTMVQVSSSFVPPILKGIQVDPKHPFKFDFILDTGTSLAPGSGQKDADRPEPGAGEVCKLIRYFLASLTIPEKDMWVNLSPYEKDRIIPDEFSMTEMGRDLLAQDYILKQITASLIYPENETGKTFWAKVYAKASEMYGTTDIPIDTFNKVWIVPNKAVVYENGTRAFVTKATLKVMLETDYEAASHQREAAESQAPAWDEATRDTALVKDIVRDVVLPILEKEVNEGANFAQLRQVYYSLILAKWYKETLKDSIINRKYSDQNKTKGVDLAGQGDRQLIYEKYLEAFKKGAFNYVKEEYDVLAEETIPRKYFSGGMDFAQKIDLETNGDASQMSAVGSLKEVVGDFSQISGTDLLNDAADFVEQGVDFAEENETPTMYETQKDFSQATIQNNKRTLRALQTRKVENTFWAIKVKQAFERFTMGFYDPKDLKVALTALRNSDILSRIIKRNDRETVVVLRNNVLKQLNTVLQDDNTDRIIDVVREGLKERLGGELIYANAKEIVFAYPEGKPLLDVESELKEVWQELWKDVHAEMLKLLDDDEDITDKERLERKEALRDEKLTLEEGAEKFLNFGISKIDGSTGKDKVLAVMRATQAMVMKKSELFSGIVFDKDNFSVAVEKTVGERDALALMFPGAFQTEVRDVEQDGEIQEKIYKVLAYPVSKVLRDRMSWKDLEEKTEMKEMKEMKEILASVGIKDKNSYEKLSKYYDLVGMVDFIKQWDMNFDTAFARSSRINERINDLEALINGEKEFDENERKELFDEIKAVIEQNPKRPDVGSDINFYSKAVALQGKAGLVSFDMVNLGGQNVREFEILVQDVYDAHVKGMEESRVNEMLTKAGDKVTDDIWSLLDEIKEYFPDVNLRGDEVYALQDLNQKKDMNDLVKVLLKIKKYYQVRVGVAENGVLEGEFGIYKYFKQLIKSRTTFKSGKDMITIVEAAGTTKVNGEVISRDLVIRALIIAKMMMCGDNGMKILKGFEKLGDLLSILVQGYKNGLLIANKYFLAPNGKGYSSEPVDFVEAGVIDGSLALALKDPDHFVGSPEYGSPRRNKFSDVLNALKGKRSGKEIPAVIFSDGSKEGFQITQITPAEEGRTPGVIGGELDRPEGKKEFEIPFSLVSQGMKDRINTGFKDSKVSLRLDGPFVGKVLNWFADEFKGQVGVLQDDSTVEIMNEPTFNIIGVGDEQLIAVVDSLQYKPAAWFVMILEAWMKTHTSGIARVQSKLSRTGQAQYKKRLEQVPPMSRDQREQVKIHLTAMGMAEQLIGEDREFEYFTKKNVGEDPRTVKPVSRMSGARNNVGIVEQSLSNGSTLLKPQVRRERAKVSPFWFDYIFYRTDRGVDSHNLKYLQGVIDQAREKPEKQFYIIDLMCGEGNVSLGFDSILEREGVKNVRVIGVDENEFNLSAWNGRPSKVIWVNDNVENFFPYLDKILEEAPGQVLLAYSNVGLMYLPDKEYVRFLRQLAPYLRSDLTSGRLVDLTPKRDHLLFSDGLSRKYDLATASDTGLSENKKETFRGFYELIPKMETKHGSMSGEQGNESKDLGGIDFNSDRIDLERQGQRAELDWGMDDAQLENINIDGLVPVITGITPVDNLPLLMGVEAGQ